MWIRIIQFIRSVVARLRWMPKATKGQALGASVRGSASLIVMKISGGAPQSGNLESIQEQVTSIKRTHDRITAVRTSNSNDHATASDINEDGSLDNSIRGRSRQGEEGTLAVCQLLVQRLNLNGAHWGEPRLTAHDARVECGIDCVARSERSALSIQVIRAETDDGFWRTLGQSGAVFQSSSVAVAAEAIRGAIEKKASRASVAQRAELVLALDAVETATQAFAPVLNEFRNKHGLWASALGYKGIWIVGPNITLVQQLA